MPLPPAAPIRPRVATVLLGLSMFLTGASGFIFECILSTVATFILGNSIEQFSVTISLMMLMMGLAGIWQRSLSDDRLVEKFLIVEVGLALLGGFAPIAVYGSYASMEMHYVAVQYFFVLAIGFLIGLEIPLVLRINRAYVPRLKSNIATVFSTDYLGAFIGALIWVYVLLRHFPLTEISFFVAGVNFLVACIAFAYFSYHGAASRRLAPALLASATAAALCFGYAQNRDWSRLFEQKFYGEPIAFAQTTRYQRLVLTASADPVDYRLYINGNLQFSSLDEHIYHEALVHPAIALARDPRRVLILGGGDGLALREVLKHDRIEEVTLVDIDPDMIRFASTHDVMTELNAGAFADARVRAEAAGSTSDGSELALYEYTDDTTGAVERSGMVSVHTIDADRFLAAASGQFDAVVIDLPDPNSVELVKLYSREFYLRLAATVAPGGLVSVQATSPYHAKESFLCILRTLRSAGYKAIPYHENVPSFGDWGWALAWRFGESEQGMRDRIGKLDQFGIPADSLRYLEPGRLRALLTFGKGALLPDSQEVNTLMHPVLLRFYLTESWLR